MAWDVDLVLMTRVLINDMVLPQKNSDEYLQQVLITAGVLIKQDIELAYDYEFDISSIAITPEPMNDPVMQALLPLKGACILQGGTYFTAVGQGIKVRDGDSAIDTSVSFRGYRDILELGPCAVYEKLKWQLQASGASGAAKAVGAVMSPYRGPNERGLNTIRWFFDEFAWAVEQGSRRSR